MTWFPTISAADKVIVTGVLQPPGGPKRGFQTSVEKSEKLQGPEGLPTKVLIKMSLKMGLVDKDRLMDIVERIVISLALPDMVIGPKGTTTLLVVTPTTDISTVGELLVTLNDSGGVLSTMKSNVLECHDVGSSGLGQLMTAVWLPSAGVVQVS